MTYYELNIENPQTLLPTRAPKFSARCITLVFGSLSPSVPPGNKKKSQRCTIKEVISVLLAAADMHQKLTTVKIYSKTPSYIASFVSFFISRPCAWIMSPSTCSELRLSPNLVRTRKIIGNSRVEYPRWIHSSLRVALSQVRCCCWRGKILGSAEGSFGSSCVMSNREKGNREASVALSFLASIRAMSILSFNPVMEQLFKADVVYMDICGSSNPRQRRGRCPFRLQANFQSSDFRFCPHADQISQSQ
jgi:hypothetical protein